LTIANKALTEADEGSQEYAYKISLNKNYNDMRNFAVFLDTPKDAQGVSHKIFFKVTYTRRTRRILKIQNGPMIIR